MAHVREEELLGARCLFGILFVLAKFFFDLDALGNILREADYVWLGIIFLHFKILVKQERFFIGFAVHPEYALGTTLLPYRIHILGIKDQQIITGNEVGYHPANKLILCISQLFAQGGVHGK